MRVDTNERYERDGFVQVRGLLDDVVVSSLRSQCVEATDVAVATVPEGGRYSLAVPGELARVTQLVETYRPVASRLLEADVAATFVLWHAVTALLSDGRGWHQALAYHHLPYSPSAVTVPLDELEVLVMLDDAIDPRMAPMFAPGHHVSPMLEHRRTEQAQMGFELVDPDRQLDVSEVVLMPLAAGDAVAYTLGTPHACICADPDSGEAVRFVRLGFRALSD